MDRKRIYNFFRQTAIWILLIQVINISIDPTDPVSDKFGRIAEHEDLDVNDIESILELVSEQCFGIDIPESDEDDESGFTKEIFEYCVSSNELAIKREFTNSPSPFSIVKLNFPDVTLDNNSPPPEVA